jgi:hypothetical protein
VPRLRLRKEWYRGLHADPVDHSKPDVGEPDKDYLVQKKLEALEDAKAGKVGRAGGRLAGGGEGRRAWIRAGVEAEAGRREAHRQRRGVLTHPA